MVIHFIVSCLIVGLVLWLINRFFPEMDPRVKQVMNIGAIVLLILELILDVTGVI